MEVMVQPMEMGLSEKIHPSRQRQWNLDQKIQKVWKPDLLRPERCHNSHTQVGALADLGDDLLDHAEWREGIRIHIVPWMQHCIRAYGHGIHHR